MYEFEILLRLHYAIFQNILLDFVSSISNESSADVKGDFNNNFANTKFFYFS